jgi:hypothetical protein
MLVAVPLTRQPFYNEIMNATQGEWKTSVAESAKKALPDKKSFVIRIDHKAAFHMGAFSQ